MSDKSSAGSTHSLRSRGAPDPKLIDGTTAPSRKAAAVWTKEEETAFLEFLLGASVADDGFKMPVFNGAAIHLKSKFPDQRGAEKTGVTCKSKWVAVCASKEFIHYH
jgi:hypothetical protein